MVFSHQSLVTPNPQSLIPSYQSLVTSHTSIQVPMAASPQYKEGDARRSLDSRLPSYHQPSPRGEGAP